jgi:dTDP-4-amino-4,6-dideoxygalactose transaminase
VVKALRLEGREILMPSYHHGVEVEALIDAGARLSFYRVGRRMEVDLADVERKITPSTAALHLTHFVGFPGPIAEMKEIAERHRLILIEDCAHALLTRVNGEPLGQTGDISLFCLYKGLPTPNGGAIVVNNPRFADLPRLASPPFSSTVSLMASSMLRNMALRGGKPGRALRRLALLAGKKALRASNIDPIRTGTEHFNRDHVSLGIAKIALRIALSHDLEDVGSTLRRNYLFLARRLGDISPPIVPNPARGVAPFFYPLIVDDNEAVVAELQARGIEAVDFWRGPHPACDIRQFPDVAWLRRSIVEIPCHQDIPLSALDHVSRIVRDVLKRRPPIRGA